MAFRSDVSKEQVDAFIAGINSLASLDGVISIHCGSQQEMYPGYQQRAQGFTHGLVANFVDRDALAAYDKHPEHVRVKTELIAPFLDKTLPSPILAIDYEC